MYKNKVIEDYVQCIEKLARIRNLKINLESKINKVIQLEILLKQKERQLKAELSK